MKRLLIAALVTGLAVTVVVRVQGRGAGTPLTADTMKGIELRSLGPGLTSGRIADVALDPKHGDIWYVA